MRSLLGLVFVFAMLTGTAFAEPLTTQEFSLRAHHAEALQERVRRVHLYQTKLANKQLGALERRGPSLNVPELDPKAGGSALALLLGGALVLVNRRKRIA